MLACKPVVSLHGLNSLTVNQFGGVEGRRGGAKKTTTKNTNRIPKKTNNGSTLWARTKIAGVIQSVSVRATDFGARCVRVHALAQSGRRKARKQESTTKKTNKNQTVQNKMTRGQGGNK
eukprot:TRINITY_DN24142_c0_g1_i1.p2 TRINITY_DN24142_c0_g1~~TRINITY_DN24142_c0_g1_i1.p2  ORF type:complete len:119 (+),score=5.02 TRINITY_DN24142_c0_g1_i1:86-442(+)